METISDRPAKKLRKEELPSLFDSTAIVVPSAFASSRLPEVEALYHSTKLGRAGISVSLNTERYESGGCKTSSRHLRRRVTSHTPRHRHRYPQAEKSVASNSAVTGERSDTKKSRRAKRNNRSYLRASHEHWALPLDTNDQPDSTAVSESSVGPSTNQLPPIKWIPTHLWHAKRFHMEHLWGWSVPMIHSNRGSKAALRLVREGKSLLQDVSWKMQPLCLLVPNNNKAWSRAQAALRCIIPQFPDAIPTDKTNYLSGDAMFHKSGSFPGGAICPVKFSIGTRPLVTVNVAENMMMDESTSNLHINLFVHPSCQELCRSELISCINVLHQHDDNMENSEPTIIQLDKHQGGVSYFQLRGRDAHLTWNLAAKKAWSSSTDNFPLYQLTEPTMLADSGGSESIRTCICLGPAEGGPLVTVIPVSSQAQSNKKMTLSQVWNHGVCGFDIVCHVEEASRLFVALVVEGGACPIGLAEESHILLESHPPVPIFPRDYIDTETGKAYWSTPPQQKQESQSHEWSKIRTFFEGGLGRVRTHGTIKFESPDWDVLTRDGYPDQLIIMVRGDLGKPFQDAFVGASGSLPTATPPLSSKIDKCKRRRPARNSTDYVIVPPLPQQLNDQLQQYCQSLLQSMSLPGAMLCHVRTEIAGILLPGIALYTEGQKKQHNRDRNAGPPVGFVTCGDFSHCRGRFHGLAVVGAFQLLQAVASGHSNQAFVTVPFSLGCTGRRETRLLLFAHCQQEKWVKVSISLM